MGNLIEGWIYIERGVGFAVYCVTRTGDACDSNGLMESGGCDVAVIAAVAVAVVVAKSKDSIFNQTKTKHPIYIGAS